ncbi:hypothetical protein SF06_34400 [Pseudomonas flexibilis]|nr:hypothetical protein SF06_34400 [Pseudomonas flexibilis]
MRHESFPIQPPQGRGKRKCERLSFGSLAVMTNGAEKISDLSEEFFRRGLSGSPGGRESGGATGRPPPPRPPAAPAADCADQSGRHMAVCKFHVGHERRTQ